jgi:hypothetical protein
VCLRGSFTHDTAAEAEYVLQLIEAHPDLEVIGAKNTFSYPNGDDKMHQMLLSCIFAPQIEEAGMPARPMLFSDIAQAHGARHGNFLLGLDILGAEFIRTGHPTDIAVRHVERAKEMLELPALQDREVRIIVEVQLHQTFYLKKRCVSHFLYKAARAKTLEVRLCMKCVDFGL